MASTRTPPLVLLAPVSGPVLPIERVPDPVFAQKLAGDGLAIDPVDGRLLAPCEAEVLQVHAAGHAVNLRAAGGAEIVLHVGLDTVALKGEGFLPHVRAGQRVQAGQLLLEFDTDFVARRSRSLLTLMVVAGGAQVRQLAGDGQHVTAGRDAVLEVRPGEEAQAAPATAAGTPVLSDEFVLADPVGMHARPAAVLAAAARRFQSQVRLLRGDRGANARSVTALMGLEVGPGQPVRLEATGADAPDALAALSALLRSAPEAGAPGAAAPAAPAPARTVPSGDPRTFTGVAAAPGLAIGQVFQLRAEDVPVAECGAGVAEERRRLDGARERAAADLQALRARLAAEADPAQAAIFAAHEELLEDPELLELAEQGLQAGHSAGFAWRRACGTHADRLAALRNELLAGRANDLRDVGRRVLRALTGAPPLQAEVPPDSIVVVQDLTPSDAAGLDRSRVRGLCSVAGGATSHVAILARSLDLPAVVAIEARALEIPDGTPAVLDGSAGTLRLAPDAAELELLKARQERQAARRRSAAARAHEPALTRDGRRIEVLANIGGLADAEQAVALGAEGVGLLRSEFLFLSRSTAPSEDEQFECYRAIARVLGPERPLIVRTLDVGGDKPLPYLPLPKEDNPFLGVRGLRLMLDHADVVRTQFRALLRAAPEGRLLVMLPMVATLAELRAARALLDEERERLGAPALPLGIMVEVPSAALMADVLAREADFFSIGTNDLTQYTLAMDRGHPRLASLVDGLEPAVLRLIAQTARAAEAAGRFTGVCGGLAGDEQAVPLLLGLGVTELSVSVPALPAIKARVRELDLVVCRALAAQALECAGAREVRELESAVVEG